jgi:CheY-like chemotaxis protein
VVHGIVKECRGDIRVYSEPGQGTTIKIYLPLHDASMEHNRLETVENYPRGNERILVVDDEEMIIDITTLHLESLGYQVTSRAGSVEALELFVADPEAFDLVITDLTMPDLTGDRLARELMAIKPTLPVIICSGFSERIGQEMAKAIGVKALLMKPIAIEELARKVRGVLDASVSSAQAAGPVA